MINRKELESQLVISAPATVQAPAPRGNLISAPAFATHGSFTIGLKWVPGIVCRKVRHGVSSWCERRRRRVGGSRPPSPPSPSSRERWSVYWRSSPPGPSSYTRCDHSTFQVFFRICLTFLSQCWGSVTFWYGSGSGSPDPYL